MARHTTPIASELQNSGSSEAGSAASIGNSESRSASAGRRAPLRTPLRFAAAAAILAAALTTTACLSAPAPSASPTATEQPTTTPSETPTPTPTPTPTSTAVTWDSFTTSDGTATFEYPSNWTVSEGSNEDLEAIGSSGVSLWAGPGEPGDSVGVWLNYGPGLGGQGGTCAAPVQYEVLDSEDMDLPVGDNYEFVQPQFQYRVLYGDQVYPSMGINNLESGPDGTACYLITAVSGPEALGEYNFGDSGTATSDWESTGHLPPFASVDDAVAYMDTDEYKTLKRVITSLTIN